MKSGQYFAYLRTNCSLAVPVFLSKRQLVEWRSGLDTLATDASRLSKLHC